MSGLYIHVPFCAQKCRYCDFLSFDSIPVSIQEAYVTALCRELDLLDFSRFKTIYLGGGTPNALPEKELERLLGHIKPESDAEFSIELNATRRINKRLAIVLENAGVTRVSFGIQTYSPRLFKAIGRKQSASVNLKPFFERFDVNVDVMYALPGEVVADWLDFIKRLARLPLAHISCYALTLEEGTPLALEKPVLPSDAEDRKMYHKAREILMANGFEHYEVSNFAKPNKRCAHNVDCWRRKPYMGAGLGAWSFDGLMRWRNETNLEKYIKEPFPSYSQIIEISKKDAMSEFMFLGLRLTDGVSVNEFEKNFDVELNKIYGDWLARMLKENFLEQKGDYLRATLKGLDFLNYVCEGFI